MSDVADNAQAENNLSRFIYWLDKNANAMFMKDVRSWLRSKQFLLMFFIGLVASQLMAFVIIFSVDETSRIGSGMFGVLMLGLGFILGGGVPHLIQDRFSEELASRASELALISRMTPAQLVRGKIFSGFAIMLIIFSSVAPVLMISYMMGGIGIAAVIYCMTILLLGSSASIVLGVLLVSMSGKKRPKMLPLLMLGAGIGLATLEVFLVDESSRGYLFQNSEFWAINIITLAIVMSALYFFYTVAISKLSFEADNRDIKPRFALSVFTLLTFTLIVLSPWIYSWSSGHVASTINLTFPAIMTAGAVFLVGVLFILDTAERTSGRLAHSWPRSRIIRTFFYPGVGRLMLYITAHFIFFLVASGFVGINLSYGMSGDANTEVIVALTVTCIGFSIIYGGLLAYQLLARFTWFKKRNFKRGKTAIVVLIFWAVFSLVGAFVVNALRGPDEFLLLSPFSSFVYLLDRSSTMLQHSFVCLIASLMIIVPAIVLHIKAITGSLKENRQLAIERKAREKAVEKNA